MTNLKALDEIARSKGYTHRAVANGVRGYLRLSSDESQSVFEPNSIIGSIVYQYRLLRSRGELRIELGRKI